MLLKDILWATPSAAGLGTLLIAVGLQILGIVASDLGFSARPVI